MDVGDKVKVIRVSWPELEEHGRFIGRTGVIERIYKTKKTIKVRFSNGETRHCFPWNLEKLAGD